MNQTYISVDDKAIDFNAWQQWLLEDKTDGAIVTFIGKVRTLEKEIIALHLEHYPEMTEKVLVKIASEVRTRWRLNRIVIIHRVGRICENENIVFVGVSSAHRDIAFKAAEFIMDVLKNEAPFWKKEESNIGSEWVDMKKIDKESLKKWY